MKRTLPEDQVKTASGEGITLYGSMGSIKVGTLLTRDLCGEIWAHVENSGSEGFYVEVARFEISETAGRFGWRRYAFQKYLGGEIGGMSARDCADYVAEVINDYHGEDSPVVHNMKNWGDT